MAGVSGDDGRERVQKVLAAAGVASRRACEELIADGRVEVDGRAVTLGDRMDPRAQVVTVDGERIPTNPDLVYLALNKPRGYVTTANDPEGRPMVTDLVPANPRVFPVGRLDRETEGLLLLTNDGTLSHRLTHPRYGVAKTYLAEIRGPARRKALAELRRGVELDDGPARARSAREVGSAADRTLVELVMVEGRKREVRRMLDAVGLPLERLARSRIGPIPLGDLPPGRHRHLGAGEVRSLYKAVGLGAGEAAAVAEPADG